MNVRATGFRIELGMLRNKVRVLETLRIGDIRSNMRAKGRRIAFGINRREEYKVVKRGREKKNSACIGLGEKIRFSYSRQ